MTATKSIAECVRASFARFAAERSDLLDRARLMCADPDLTDEEAACSGPCETFAEWLVADLKAEGFAKVGLMSTDFFTADEMPTYEGGAEPIDVDLLADIEGERAQELEGVQVPLHVWVEAEGMHFDAQTPEGVESLVDLPHFQRLARCPSPSP